MLFDPKRMAEPTAPKALPVALEDVRLAVGGATLVDGISLTLERGPRTVIMGPNGAGKSLLLRIVQGLIEPTSGRVTHAGAAPTPAIRKRIALVFQRPVLLRRSVAANLDHALKVYGVESAHRPDRIGELLRMADLAGMADRPARVLSGGEQQRLALVRALAADPELLLLDEPTASLDPRATHAIEGLIAGAHTRGTKIVLVTHDRGQATRLADEVVFLNAGRLCERTPADRFFTRPSSEEAAAYLEGRLLL